MSSTYAEYVLFEQHSQVRHEFLDGEIYAMAGGTPEHAVALRLIGNQLPSGCRTYTSDLRIRIAKSDLTTYPDGAVICGKVAPAANDQLAATNPTLIVEVTSPSTEAYDRGAKLDHYRSLDSLREIVIVAHDTQCIDVHRRGRDGKWSIVTSRAGETVGLDSIGGSLRVADVYAALS
ncbi:MAG: Uma2 family endonuclease [Archangium sp.]